MENTIFGYGLIVLQKSFCTDHQKSYGP